MARDYFVSATVRNNAKARAVTGKASWWLKTYRINAPSLTAARAKAISMIEAWDYEYGELQILWDASPAIVVTEGEMAALFPAPVPSSLVGPDGHTIQDLGQK